jgi:hypothetical protein
MSPDPKDIGFEVIGEFDLQAWSPYLDEFTEDNIGTHKIKHYAHRDGFLLSVDYWGDDKNFSMGNVELAFHWKSAQGFPQNTRHLSDCFRYASSTPYYDPEDKTKYDHFMISAADSGQHRSRIARIKEYGNIVTPIHKERLSNFGTHECDYHTRELINLDTWDAIKKVDPIRENRMKQYPQWVWDKLITHDPCP